MVNLFSFEHVERRSGRRQTEV